jgi:uncharacterized integral membrane protein
MPTQAQSITRKSKDRRKKPWFIPFLGTLAVLLILLLLLLLVSNSVRTFLAIIYSPFAFAIMLIVVLEYVILKAVDRSRIYRLEIERLRSKRAEDIALWRDLEGHLSEALKRLQELEGGAATTDPDASLSSLRALRSKLEEILRILRKKT